MEFDFPLIWCYLYARSYKCLNSPFKKNAVKKMLYIKKSIKLTAPS